tara:strand:+ start:571 stop:1374 length:804 start_codon:yes stop_codon:yes gene_type:complete
MDNEKMIKYRIEGHSYREISKKFKKSLRDVYRVCYKVKMSKIGLKRYSKLKGKTKNIIFLKGLNDKKIRIICNLIFDGSVYKTKNYHYTMMYVNNSIGLIQQFIKDMKEVYNVKPSSYEKIKKYQRVKFLSKRIYQDLMKYTNSYSTSNNECTIPIEILKNKGAYKLILLQSFWDNEGSISNDGRLSADSKSLKVIKQLSHIHNEFGITHKITEYRNKGTMYKLYLSKTQENYNKFLKLKLFSKSNVVRGYNSGKLKLNVLKNFIIS